MSAPAVRPFPWGPKHYLRWSILLSIGVHAYLYLGMLVLSVLVNGQRWMLGWKPLAIAVASTLLFTHFSYRWIMRLDAQYGRGRGWALVSRTIKLPEQIERPQ